MYIKYNIIIYIKYILYNASFAQLRSANGLIRVTIEVVHEVAHAYCARYVVMPID